MEDETVSLTAGIVFGAAVGLTAMYVLDPDMGKRRWALTRDKIQEARTKTRRAGGATARDLWNRTTGTIAEARSHFSEKEVSDEVLEARVRSKLGFLVRHPRAIKTQVSGGQVRLSGPVLADEARQLVDGAANVRGVRAVADTLKIYNKPGEMPGVQAEKVKPTGEVWDIMQRRWSPSTRFLVGTAGAISLCLIAYSLTDRSRAAPARAQQTWRRRVVPGREETVAGWAI
jgi:hypothetical protein